MGLSSLQFVGDSQIKKNLTLFQHSRAFLKQLKTQQEKIPGFKDDWYIFNRWNGTKYQDGYIPATRTTIYRRFDEAIASSGVKKIRIHDLRHSGATHAIISGEDIKAVSE